jgi:transcriptional regulator with XRE-family HTH domain
MSTKKYTSKIFYKEYGQLTFGELLKSFRVCDEISQMDFAKRLGVSPANLCDLEKGRKIPSAKRAAFVAKQLGLPEALLIQVALQDELRKSKLKYKVTVAA